MEREISEWIARRDHDQELLGPQQLLIAGAENDRDELVAPPWRDYRAAATVDGEAFFIATVGSRKAE